MEGGRYSPNELGRPLTKLLFAIFQQFNLQSLSSGMYLVDKRTDCILQIVLTVCAKLAININCVSFINGLKPRS